MSDPTPSDILRSHGVRNARSCVRELARHGYGFGRIDEELDDAGQAEADSVLDPWREDEGGVMLDMTRAVHPEELHSSTIDGTPVECIALVVKGRVNQSEERVKLGLILHADAAVDLAEHVTRFVGVYSTWRKAFGLDELYS